MIASVEVSVLIDKIGAGGNVGALIQKTNLQIKAVLATNEENKAILESAKSINTYNRLMLKND